MQSLLQIDCIPAGMELFPAADGAAWDIITEEIERSDYYVLIIGGRYGSTTEEGISYTEREYDHACESGVPVLAFVHKDPDSLPVSKTDKDQAAAKRLETFREKVMKSHHCALWSSAPELGTAVMVAILRARKASPRAGWVRGSQAATPELLQELAELRAVVAKQALPAASQPPPHTESLLQGEDGVPVEFSFEAYDAQEYINTSYPNRQNYTLPKNYLTWDEIFRAIGPKLYDEGSEEEMRKAACAAALHKLNESSQAQIARPRNMTMTSIAFEAVKMQLVALGLIARGEKKRAPSITATFWKLTPYGEHVLMGLSALRKKDVAAAQKQVVKKKTRKK